MTLFVRKKEMIVLCSEFRGTSPADQHVACHSRWGIDCFSACANFTNAPKFSGKRTDDETVTPFWSRFTDSYHAFDFPVFVEA